MLPGEYTVIIINIYFVFVVLVTVIIMEKVRMAGKKIEVNAELVSTVVWFIMVLVVLGIERSMDALPEATIAGLAASMIVYVLYAFFREPEKLFMV